MRYQSTNELYLFSLITDGESMFAEKTEDVIAELRRISGKDLGDDTEAWIEWLHANDVDELMKARSNS